MKVWKRVEGSRSGAELQALPLVTVKQPWRDALIRTAGYAQPNPVIQDRHKLFQTPGLGEGNTNLPTGAVLPSDQSMVVLALRVFTWFRNSVRRGTPITLADGVTVILGSNGDWAFPNAANSPAFGAALNGQAIGNVNDVHRLYWQAAESLFWSFGAGDKFSIQSMPTASNEGRSIKAANSVNSLARPTPNEARFERVACV